MDKMELENPVSSIFQCLSEPAITKSSSKLTLRMPGEQKPELRTQNCYTDERERDLGSDAVVYREILNRGEYGGNISSYVK